MVTSSHDRKSAKRPSAPPRRHVRQQRLRCLRQLLSVQLNLLSNCPSETLLPLVSASVKSGAFCPGCGAPADPGSLRADTELKMTSANSNNDTTPRTELEILPPYTCDSRNARTIPTVAKNNAAIASAGLSTGIIFCQETPRKNATFRNSAARARSKPPHGAKLLRRCVISGMMKSSLAEFASGSSCSPDVARRAALWQLSFSAAVSA